MGTAAGQTAFAGGLRNLGSEDFALSVRMTLSERSEFVILTDAFSKTFRTLFPLVPRNRSLPCHSSHPRSALPSVLYLSTL